MIPNFKTWISTINPFKVSFWPKEFMQLLVDPTTGAPMGVQSPASNGPQGVWAPVQITAEQVMNPPAGMVADLWARYQLNVPPYWLYWSNGSYIENLTGPSSFPGSVPQTIPYGVVYTIGYGSYAVVYAPMHIQGTLHVQGRLDVVARP